jgi:hypothetical protein
VYPVKYTGDVETLVENEASLIAEIVTAMGVTQRRAFDTHRHASRDAHAKSHGFLKGTLTVPSGLEPELAQGMFASPAKYPVIIRLSSAPGDLHSDKVPAPRGFAMKVIGVAGERLLSADAGHNQDFLLVNIPTLSFGTIPAYKKMLKLLEENSHRPEFLQRALAGAAHGIAEAAEALQVEPGATLRGLGRDNSNILGETFHSMAAIRFGDYIAKISVAPLSENVRSLTGIPMDDLDESRIRDVVVEHFRNQGAQYELRAQLCADLAEMPVEDASVLWNSEASPHRSIATIDIPAQEAFSPARRVYGDDVLSFNVWHGIAEHRPLGSIMRSRVQAYERSTAFRHQMNLQPRIEPDNIASIPD